MWPSLCRPQVFGVCSLFCLEPHLPSFSSPASVKYSYALLRSWLKYSFLVEAFPDPSGKVSSLFHVHLWYSLFFFTPPLPFLDNIDSCFASISTQ